MKYNKYKDWTKEELIDEIKKIKKNKKYGIVWDTENSKEYFEEISNGKLPILSEDESLSINNDEVSEPTHLIIEGDNYHSLSVLNYTHENSIDLIYIDPPYNTLNKGFVYNDSRVDKDDGYRHSKWLSFMEKRLKLAKRLLKDGGVIFISIDDHEVSQLKLLCDDIFHNGFIRQVVWKRHSGGGNDSTYFAVDHEYILVYSKGEAKPFWTELSEEKKADYKYTDGNFEKWGPYKIKTFKRSRPDDPRENLRYKIICDDGTELYDEWRWEEKKFLEEKKKDPSVSRIVINKNNRGEWSVNYKIYLYNSSDEEEETNERMEKPRSLFLDIASNAEGKKELEKIFSKKDVFSNPKPVNLIKYLIKISTRDKNAKILDFFAGSGTTGQAVLELNKEDNGKRQFILCSNKEDLPVNRLISQINREEKVNFDVDSNEEVQILDMLESRKSLYVLIKDEPTVEKLKCLSEFKVTTGNKIKFIIMYDKNKDIKEITKSKLRGIINKTEFRIITSRSRKISNNDFTLMIKYYDELKNLCKDVCYERNKRVINGYEFLGKEKELLFEKKIGINELKNGNEIYQEYQKIRNNNAEFFDEIKPEWESNTLRVYGYKKINGFKEGLGGNLRYFKTDFVNEIATDADKKSLVDKSTDMIRIKESAFMSVYEGEYIRIYKNDTVTTAILFKDTEINNLQELFRELHIHGDVNVYVFSLEDDDYTEEFQDFEQNVKVCNIPAAILKTYRRIFSYGGGL